MAGFHTGVAWMKGITHHPCHREGEEQQSNVADLEEREQEDGREQEHGREGSRRTEGEDRRTGDGRMERRNIHCNRVLHQYHAEKNMDLHNSHKVKYTIKMSK